MKPNSQYHNTVILYNISLFVMKIINYNRVKCIIISYSKLNMGSIIYYNSN